MPLLAEHTDKVAIVRSVTHRSDVHEPSVYHMMTGKVNPLLVVPRNQRRRSDFPNVASIVAHFSERGPLPATCHHSAAGRTRRRHLRGHLRRLPRFARRSDGAAEAPNSKDAAHALAAPPDVDTVRLHARRGLVNLIEAEERYLNQTRTGEALGGFYEDAFRMTSSPAAKRAFNLNLEPPAVRDRYGRNEYGDSFLLARRLVEAGVRLVSVVWMYIFPEGRVANVWDNHAGYGIHGAKTGFDLLEGPVCLGSLDRAYSSLLSDLAERGLLDETLVVAVGEFGRTPKINPDSGRDHWGACQSALLAGGGVRGGQVYGSSDKQAAFVKDNPVSPEDLLATIYHAFGLPPEAEIHDREGRPHRVCEGRAATALFGGGG